MIELTFAATESFPAVPPLSVFASPRRDRMEQATGFAGQGRDCQKMGKMPGILVK
jgi:hypothetical protein